MSFNPGSFTSTQNAGPKPQIIKGLQNPGATVTEGQTAVAYFDFIDPATFGGANTGVQLMDTATVNASFDGTSAADVGTLKFGIKYFTTTSPGYAFSSSVALGGSIVVPGFGTVTSTAQGAITFTDYNSLDPNMGTGVMGVYLELPVNTDNIPESGEHLLFKLTQSDAVKFTNSFYVESKIDIQDAVNAVSSVSPTASLTGTAATDSFNIAALSTVWRGGYVVTDTGPTSVPAAQNFQTIGASTGSGTTFAVTSGTTLGVGDKIKVDMATGNQLSMVNFGSLAAVGITTQDQLVNGLRALNGIDANVGGLYMMQVTEDMDTGAGVNNVTSTYIIFDSNGNGKLDTDGAVVASGSSVSSVGTFTTPADDVFVKVLGVSAASIQSTHFDLF